MTATETPQHASPAHPAGHDHDSDHDHDHDGDHGHDDDGDHGHDHGRQAAGENEHRYFGVTREYLLVALSGLFTAIGLLGEFLAWPDPLTIALFVAAIAAGGLEIVPRGLIGVFKEQSLDINFLITIAVAGAMVLGEWGEGATVVFLFALGEALESATLARTRRAIQGLMAMAPETAQVKAVGGAERTLPVEEVPVGATVVVRPGDRVPLDGTILMGKSALNQAPITGESVPVDKTPGDVVYAGTINTTGYLEIKTTKPFAENTLARIIHLVEDAQAQKAPSQRFVERFARVYTPLVVLLAVLLAFVPPLVLNEPIVPWFNRALVMLLIACPCALVLATPVSVVAAIGNASRHGVLVKGGAYLERAGAIRAVAFDKTGTLTRGVPEVKTIIPLNGLSERDVLALAAAAEARSEHPLAAAICRAAQRRGVTDLPTVDHFLALPGSGIQASVNGAHFLIGKPSWLASTGLALDPFRASLDAMTSAGHSAVLVARQAAGRTHEPVAIIGIADELRASARQTVEALRRLGVRRILMLSGDHPTTAAAIAQQAGIHPEDVRGGLLPEEKVASIQELVRTHKQVAMVGDGVNDAPALAAATVGIAMGAGGSDTALETADVALVADDLTRVPWVLGLSRRAARTIKFNIGIALATKAVVAVLAVFGLANLWLAITTDVGATVLVILNGMRLLGGVSAGAPHDEPAVRARFGLGKRDPHAGHAH